jgi:hypothetical protein
VNGPLKYALENYGSWPFIVAAAWWLRGKIMDYTAKADETHKILTQDMPTSLNEQTKLLISMDKSLAVLCASRENRRERSSD